MKNDFIKPIVVLSLICLIISGALAFTDSVTSPVIIEAAAKREEDAREEIIPDATGFEPIEVDGLPETVSGVYKSKNDVGYVFVLVTKGYGGDMTLLCGIKPDGTVIRCTTLEQSETKGMGSRVTERQFEDQFIGADANLQGVDTISGATISSKAYIAAIKDALAAFNLIDN